MSKQAEEELLDAVRAAFRAGWDAAEFIRQAQAVWFEVAGENRRADATTFAKALEAK